MSELEKKVELFAGNPEQRCACMLLLDTSGSMEGDKIRALNEGLGLFKQAMTSDPLACIRVEIGVITFDSDVKVVHDFSAPDDFAPPQLTAQGLTHMAEGMTKALDMVEARKSFYRANNVSYYRPWVFMITDGEPQGEAEAAIQQAARRVKDEEESHRVVFYAVGVQDANMHRLGQMVVRTPLKLAGLNFRELFVWLSKSIGAVARSKPTDGQVPLPPAGWATT